MPTLDRRVHYEAAEESRESVQTVDLDGNDLTKEEAIERLGGAKAEYTEVMVANSRLECEALFARQPEREHDEVMRDFYAAQAAKLDTSGRAVVFVHGDPDGGYHAHILLPGKETDYSRLDGPNGKAQYAWNQVWVEGRPPVPIHDWETHARAKSVGEDLAKLNFKAARKSLVEERKGALKDEQDPAKRNDIRESFADREADLEGRHHALKLAHLEAMYAAHSLAGSLEHQVEIDRENVRHLTETRRAEARRAGDEMYYSRYTSRDQQEAFRHMTADQRVPGRREALARETDAIRRRFEAEKRVIDQDPTRFQEEKEALSTAHDHRCKDALEAAGLRYQAGLLRDREEDITKAPGQSIPERLVRSRMRRAASRIPGASMTQRADALLTRTDLMAQRHALERQALVADARSRGLQEPSAKALGKLDTRQKKERDGLAKNKARLAILTPTRQATKSVKQVGRRAISGSLVKARQSFKKVQEATKKGEKHRSLEQAEAIQGVAEGTAISAVGGVAKVGLTAAVEAGKSAAHQVQNLGQAAMVTIQATATAIVNPLAGGKVASESYAKVGSQVAKDAAQDMASGSKAVGKDVAKAGHDSAEQALSGMASLGMDTMPKELSASIRATKQASLAAVRTAKSLVTLDLLGAATSAGQGVLSAAREAGEMLRGKLPMPAEKVLDLASKVPLVGLVADGAKVAAEVGIGAGKGTKILEFER